MRTENVFCDNCSVEIKKGTYTRIMVDFVKLDGTSTWFDVGSEWGNVDLCGPCTCRLVIKAAEEALKECDPALNTGGES